MSEQSSEPQELRLPADELRQTLVYESNPKHSEPWQPGRKGSICDQDVRQHAATLLRDSELVGDKRFAVFNGRAYCAQQHRPGIWHGYPVGWIEVPPRLQRHWKQSGSLTKRQLKQYWEAHQ